MLKTDEYINLGDYNFKSSPESSTDESFVTDSPSDEDFLQQLSSDLDIPLLLNGGEDEMSMLNSFLDRSPEEILSEVTSLVPSTKCQNFDKEFSDLQQLDISQWGPESFPNLMGEIKLEPGEIFSSDDSVCSSDTRNISPTPSQLSDNVRLVPEVKPEDFIFDPSPLSFINETTLPKSTNNFILKDENQGIKYKNSCQNNTILPHNFASKMKMVHQNVINIGKLPSKRVVITSRHPYNISTQKNKKVVFVPTSIETSNRSTISPHKLIQGNGPPQKVVVLENICPVTVTPLSTANAVTTIPQITTITNPITASSNTFSSCLTLPVTSTVPLSMSTTFDSKVLKRQQRMIKNRESACLSRKKKKDYVTALEKQVQELTLENETLKMENYQLKERLSQGVIPTLPLPNKNLTKTLAVCAVFFVMAFNIESVRGPLNFRNSALSNLKQVPVISDHHGRSLLWTPDSDIPDTVPANSTNNSSLTMCPIYINQTENVRLALELHKLIGKPYNISDELHINARFGEKVSKGKPKSKSTGLKTGSNSLESRTLSSLYKFNKRSKKLSQTYSGNELQVFSPTAEQIYAEFFEAINRQDDTFYVVSFSPDHLLLPALNHNKTRRPKMSLLMPSVLPNDSNSQHSYVSLMQIDCEVIDTHLIHVDNGVIPQHLRTRGNLSNTKYSNTTDDNISNSSESNENNNNTSHQTYKPYFMRKSYLKSKDQPLYYNTIKSRNKNVN